MFVVNFHPDNDIEEIFGSFSTATDAIDWMNVDVNYNIETAKKNGINLEAETFNNGNGMMIEDYGTWMVQNVIPVEKH